MPTRSPPHTRGQGHGHNCRIYKTRITPAHAGTSRASPAGKPGHEDHPRTRGDKPVRCFRQQSLIGSPPHTRGQGARYLSESAHTRITPAHAGTSYDSFSMLSYREDHPRTRGDKLAIWAVVRARLGSPPHPRGQGREKAMTRGRKRITPAHAGTSKDAQEQKGSSQDHPRTRGDKQERRQQNGKISGSPPHTRGQADVPVTDGVAQRITPAHAGTSRKSSKFPSSQ